jgi:hypothetical protein
VQLIDGTLGQPIITISFRTISVGHHARDALPLLGNPLLPIELRRDLARQVSLAERKRYRFLDDAGSWIQSGGLDSSMPEATLAEQAAGGVLTDVGPSEAGGGIRAHNALSRIIYVGVAGEGQRVWEKVEPGKTVFFGIPPGLFALTTWDRGYVTRNVHLAPKRLYDFRIRG